MNFETWEPVYRAICRDFGYSIDADRRARDVLADLVGDVDGPPVPEWAGREVAIVGGAPRIEADFPLVDAADVVVAVSQAADRLLRAGYDVDIMVTDLDKNPRRVVSLTQAGVPVVIHAHGDNRESLRRWVPQCDCEFVLPTTQAEPTDAVRNFGGFTDGDRAAFLADHAGAHTLHFPGWDFDDPNVSAEKRKKLIWAERLLYWLERRRDDRFAVLDGRRRAIDTRALPVD